MKILDVLAKQLGAGPRRAKPRARWLELEASAPTNVRPILRALAIHETPYLSYGWRQIYGDDCDTFEKVFDALRISVNAVGVDPRRSVHLGATGGGEILFGLCWDAKGVRFVEIDVEPPIRVRTWPVASYFEHLATHEVEKCEELEDEVGEALVDLAKALKKRLPSPS